MLQEAMVRAGVLSPVYRYYASEIDKWPIKVTQQNWPDTQQVGDIHNVDLHTFNGDPIAVSYTHLTLPTTPYV